ncbi:MAG: hypothetical protein JO041_13640 [Acidobacteria bacterium]|nr:hypothetical protein [Acidobacteriota bacterium]
MPWRVIGPKTPAPSTGLLLYWFPSSLQDLKTSSLLRSRELKLYASQCVTMGIGDSDTPFALKLPADAKAPMAFLTDPDGAILGRADADAGGHLDVGKVEDLVGREFRKREETVKSQLKEALELAGSGDKDRAVSLLQSVEQQKCMFPGPAKRAARELKKLGTKTAQGL